tara:strand:- start:808 stop:1311 length:504 start_codon:yes stop_codon:yes gene_type:complete
MSLNKFSTSTDYLQKQYLNIGCNSIKCTSLEVNGSVAGGSFEYTPTVQTNIPADMTTSANPSILWHTNGDQMSLSVRYFDLILPTGTADIQFEIPLPTGYAGAGLGSEKVSFAGAAIDGTTGTAFLPISSFFSLDNANIVYNFKANAAITGTFNTSMQITCKIVKSA